MSELVDNRFDCTDRTGWLIQVALAVYLIPALLIVLVVGGVGMLVLTSCSTPHGSGSGIGH